MVMHWIGNKQKREKIVTVPQCVLVWLSGKAREREREREREIDVLFI